MQPTRCIISVLLFVLLSPAVRCAESQDLSGAAKEASRSPDEKYTLGQDSQIQPEVPEGRVLEFTMRTSKIYPGYEHRWWLYIPPNYDGRRALALMVFLDGGEFLHRDGLFRTPIVMNNLIAQHRTPEMAAIFVNPGEARQTASDGSPLFKVLSNRSVEYDTLSQDYANFLVNEILPKARGYVNISDDPEMRGVGGHSSGGLAAFTIAWQRPDQFRKVYSANGSFTKMKGGDAYPDIVRRSPRKPIRVYQLGGANDMVHPRWGSWALANQRMAEALEDSQYKHRFVFGNGTHYPAHAASAFPDALEWLWSSAVDRAIRNSEAEPLRR